MNQLFARLKDAPDRIEFHPEGTVGNHVALVTLRAMVLTGDVDLVMAGLFHDLFKPQVGYDHPQAAYNFLTDDYTAHTFIKAHGADPKVVEQLCLNHMKGKVEGILPKSAKQTPKIDTFQCIDDMVHRHTLPTRTAAEFTIPGKGTFHNVELTFAGQSPLQQHCKNGQFTVTANRTPYTYRLNEIPKFFINYPEIAELLQLMVKN